MASISDEPLSKEEQEDEEMRNELTAVGLFYENMDREEMKTIISVLKESREASKGAATSSKSSQNVSEPLEDSSVQSTATFSNQDSVDIGNMSVQSTSKEHLNNNEKNPESTSNISFVKNINSKSPDRESILEKNTNLSKEDYPLLRSKSSFKSNIGDESKLRPKENKKPTQAMLRKINLERWRLNPLQCVEDENDVPLSRPERVHIQEDEPLPYIKEECDFERFEELCQQMSKKLESLHEKIIPDEPTRDTNSQWGSPIKVATKWNGSLDKNPPVEKTPLQTRHSPDIPLRNTHDRATKRKALSTIAAVTRDENSEDENSDNEFVDTKKRKFQQEKRAEEVTKKNQESQQNKTCDDVVEMIEVDDNKDIEEFDNSNVHSLRRGSNIKNSKNSESNQKQSEFPRRVIPPNPSKKSFKGPRCKKKTATQSQNSLIKNNGLNDEEIIKTLNELNEQIDDNDCVEITNEIKPAPMSKYQTKFQMACSHLENVHNADEQKTKAEEEAKKQKEREERQKKEELISRRLQDEENERKRKLEIEKKSNEKTEAYNTLLNSQTRITRSNFNKKRQTYEELNEDSLLNGDDDESIITCTSIPTTSLCPICQRSFPPDEIAAHASGCNEFLSESDEINIYQPSTSRTGMSTYECLICNKYKTYDGNMYEDHMVQCKANAEDRRNGIYV